MIIVNGSNQFKDNCFSYSDWSAPLFETHNELVDALRTLRLEGRVVKHIYCVGMAYNWREDDVADAVYVALEELSPQERATLPNPSAFLPQGIYLNRMAEIDEPLLIEFEDGDILEVDFSSENGVRVAMNTIPKNIDCEINPPTFHPDELFSDMLGCEIREVQIVTTLCCPEFVYTDRDSYIAELRILYDDVSHWYPHRVLSFYAHCDYGYVNLIDRSGAVMKIHAPEVKKVVAGFIEEAILNS